MNNNLKLIIVAILIAFVLGGVLTLVLTPIKVEKVPIIKEKIVIKESERVYDSLSVELSKSNKRTLELIKKRNEKTNSYKPLERVVINDSIRTNNVSRFFK